MSNLLVKLILCLGFSAAVVLAAPSAHAGAVAGPVAGPVISYQDDHNDALKAMKRGEILSLGKIKNIVERKLKGRMVGERLRRTNRGWVYEVRVRGNDGKVMFAIVNAANGKIISRR